jgi:hypothetical protein
MPTEILSDSLSSLINASRMDLHAAEEPTARPASPEKPPTAGLAREYLATCQKLEQLVERKQRVAEEMVDTASIHQELCLIGTRIQREPDDRSHEEDYIAVLKKAKDSILKRIEADDLKGEFQKLHFQLLGFGHKLGFDHSSPTPADLESEYDEAGADDMNLSDVERQIAELQAQIRSLHNHQ